MLQLFGINLTAAILFCVFGLKTRGTRYSRGKQWVFPVTFAVTIVALIGLLSWQLTNPPNLQRSTRAQRANAEVQQVVESSGIAQLVEANIRFTRPNLQGQNTQLGVVYVQRQSGVNASSEEIRTSLTRKIQTHLLEQGFNATPLIDVSVLEAPE